MARGVPTKIVGDYIVYVEKPAVNALVVRKDLYDSGEIKSAADLKGRTIAITARGQFTHLLAGKALESGGHTVDDARLVPLSYPHMGAGFQGASIEPPAFVAPLTPVTSAPAAAAPTLRTTPQSPGTHPPP